MAVKMDLMAFLKAMGFDQGYVRIVKVDPQDKSKILGHITAYAIVSKQDGLPTVRLVVQNFANGSGSLAISYDMARIATWAEKLLRFIQVVGMARAMASLGLVEFYMSEQPKAQPTKSMTPQPSQATPDMQQLMAMLMANPALLQQFMKNMAQKSHDEDEGEVYVGRHEGTREDRHGASRHDEG